MVLPLPANADVDEQTEAPAPTKSKFIARSRARRAVDEAKQAAREAAMDEEDEGEEEGDEGEEEEEVVEAPSKKAERRLRYKKKKAGNKAFHAEVEEASSEDDNVGEDASCDAPDKENEDRQSLNFDLPSNSDDCDQVLVHRNEMPGREFYRVPSHVRRYIDVFPFFFRAVFRFLCLYSFPLTQIRDGLKKEEWRDFRFTNFMHSALCITSVMYDSATFGPVDDTIKPKHIYLLARVKSVDLIPRKKRPYKKYKFVWRFAPNMFLFDPPIPLPSGVGQCLAMERCKTHYIANERSEVVCEIMRRLCKLLAQDPNPGYHCLFLGMISLFSSNVCFF